MVSEFFDFMKELQIKLTNLLEFDKVEIEKIKRIACVDVAYKNDKYFGVGLISNINFEKIFEKVEVSGKIFFKYKPSFFFLTEGPIVLKIIRKFKTNFDVLLLDAHGYAHPRRMGLACVIGIIIQKPTIGIAKSLLCGRVEKIDERIFRIVDNNETIGFKIIDERPFYVSVGNKIDLESLLKFFERINFKYPKILKIADKIAKEKIRENF